MYPLEFKWKINIALGKIKKVIGEITREVERKGEIEINLDVWGEESSWLEVFAGMIKKIKKKRQILIKRSIMYWYITRCGCCLNRRHAKEETSIPSIPICWSTLPFLNISKCLPTLESQQAKYCRFPFSPHFGINLTHLLFHF